MAIISNKVITEDYNDDKNSIIKLNLEDRTFDGPTGYVVAVTGDNNSQLLTFQVPSEYDGIDLFGTFCILTYYTSWLDDDDPPKNSKGTVMLDGKEVITEEGEEVIQYEWLLNLAQTAKSGYCKFTLTFYLPLEENFYYEYNYAFPYSTLEFRFENNKWVIVDKEANRIYEDNYYSLTSNSGRFNIIDPQMGDGGEYYIAPTVVDALRQEIYNKSLSNALLNNKKINDENNVVGHKGYKMLYGTQKLSEDKNSITIELRDAQFADENKAINTYAVGDLVNLEASSSLYQRQKIAQLSTNPDTQNTLITLVEVKEGAEISFHLEAKDPEQTDEEYEINQNWVWVTDKFVGEDIPSIAYAVASGHDTHAIGHGAFSTGHHTRAHGHYASAFGIENTALFCAFATGLRTKATGIRAVTFGCQTIASAIDSLAMGANTNATGQSSFAGGDAAKTYGIGSIAYGLRATTEGNYSAAFGRDTKSGTYALVAGQNTVASGTCAVASGSSTEASGQNSLAVGLEVKATGLNSFAQGNKVQATGSNSIALGSSTTASGNYSLVMGYSSKAIGSSSFAGGSAASANNECSFAFGLRAKTNNDYQVVFGKDNDTTTTDGALLVVGNGTSNTKKSNAFVVNSNGTATVKKDPVNAMDVATKQYVDNLKNGLILTDKTTGTDYKVYIDNGKLQLEEVTA